MRLASLMAIASSGAFLALPSFAQSVATPLPPPAQSPATPRLTQQDIASWADGFMPYALKSGDIAGAVVVVVKDGAVLFEKGYGYSDIAARSPVDPDRTLFRVGSTSKLFTWTAVMQLVEQGKIDLDADVNQYLDFKIPPREGTPITMRNIMTHTAGFEERLTGLIGVEADGVEPLDRFVKRYIPSRIFAPGMYRFTNRSSGSTPSYIPSRIFAPGETPAYSNYATALAG